MNFYSTFFMSALYL